MIPPVPATRWFRRAALSALAAAWLAPAAPAAAEGPDTLGVHFEAGASSDVTNELFYEDAFVDTTFLGRRTVSTPERRYAGVLLGAIAGTRNFGATVYRLQNELSLGDKLSRNTLALDYRNELSPAWKLFLSPAMEYRHDRSFDRDLEQWRANAGIRLRRRFQDDATFAEWRGSGELLRSRGTGADFIPDRQTGRVGVAIDHFALLGDEWRAGYNLTARSFPDSVVRDHFEHGFDGRFRHAFGFNASVALEVDGIRRVTRREAPTSRDQFWHQRAGLEGIVRMGDRVTWLAAVEGEMFRYDLEDSTIYFNYQVVRARLAPRIAGGPSWSITAGPKGEMLFSRLAAEEEYREVGGSVELELLARGAWWNILPSAGWRHYAAATGDLSIHSSYAFYELSVFGDQPLAGGLRLRAVGTGRLQSHIDSAQDSRSLYISLELRYLF